MDQIIGYLFEKLTEVNILNNLNVILLSDHGMAEIKNNYAADEFVDINLVDTTKSYFDVVSNIYPKKEADVKMLDKQ